MDRYSQSGRKRAAPVNLSNIYRNRAGWRRYNHIVAVRNGAGILYSALQHGEEGLMTTGADQRRRGAGNVALMAILLGRQNKVLAARRDDVVMGALTQEGAAMRIMLWEAAAAMGSSAAKSGREGQAHTFFRNRELGEMAPNRWLVLPPIFREAREIGRRRQG